MVAEWTGIVRISGSVGSNGVVMCPQAARVSDLRMLPGTMLTNWGARQAHHVTDDEYRRFTLSCEVLVCRAPNAASTGHFRWSFRMARSC